MNFKEGAFGNPQETSALIFFWQKMEQLHYPGAAETRALLENKLQKETALAQIQSQQQVNIPQEMPNTANSEVYI